ncbi:hypothetical protein [Saccharopolyspora hattusasensis]|uniref:hypothetical protein n=1 Tax=Saccharopolyspora hattusasensis TaxID=1128679 RepID=UPI003D95AD1C
MFSLLLFLAGLLVGLVLPGLLTFKMHVAEPTGQHTGSGEGSLTVAHLRKQVERGHKRDRGAAESTGRHALPEDVAARVAAIVGM